MDPIVKTVDRAFLRCDTLYFWFLFFLSLEHQVKINFSRCAIAKRLMPSLPAVVQERALVLTFSQIAAFLRCPCLFKLRTLYGWAATPNEVEGFGSLFTAQPASTAIILVSAEIEMKQVESRTIFEL